MLAISKLFHQLQESYKNEKDGSLYLQKEQAEHEDLSVLLLHCWMHFSSFSLLNLS